jgi:hypothetical protein
MTATSKYHPHPKVPRTLESIHILAREITWQHDTREPQKQHEWPQFATTIKESGRVAPFPSVHLPRDTTRWAIRGWPRTLSRYTSLQQTWRIVQLGDHRSCYVCGVPYSSYASVHNSNLLTGARSSVLNWHRRGLTTSKLRICHLSTLNLPIKYSPQPSNWPHPVSHRATIRLLT